MKDEVLQKALTTDTTVIPRYDVIRPDGTKVAENVQLVLKNTVLTAGTPLNKNTLLRDEVKDKLGLTSVSDPVPSDAFLAIRNAIGYCPRLQITGQTGSTIYVQRLVGQGPSNTTTNTNTYTIPANGRVLADLLYYGIYRVWGVCDGVRLPDTLLNVDTNKTYSLVVSPFVVNWPFSVGHEVGAVITATHSDSGNTIVGSVGIDKKCTLELCKPGIWNCKGRFADRDSSLISIFVDATGEVSEKTFAWTKVVVTAPERSKIEVSRGSVVYSGEIINGAACIFWTDSSGAWTVKGTLGDKTATVTVYPAMYQVSAVNISYTT